MIQKAATIGSSYQPSLIQIHMVRLTGNRTQFKMVSVVTVSRSSLPTMIGNGTSQSKRLK